MEIQIRDEDGNPLPERAIGKVWCRGPSVMVGYFRDPEATEACLAIKLARKKSKRWILQAYVNQVFYGNRAYGIEAASRTYFSKPASKLLLSEAALLAGLAARTRYATTGRRSSTR